MVRVWSPSQFMSPGDDGVRQPQKSTAMKARLTESADTAIKRRQGDGGVLGLVPLLNILLSRLSCGPERPEGAQSTDPPRPWRHGLGMPPMLTRLRRRVWRGPTQPDYAPHLESVSVERGMSQSAGASMPGQFQMLMLFASLQLAASAFAGWNLNTLNSIAVGVLAPAGAPASTISAALAGTILVAPALVAPAIGMTIDHLGDFRSVFLWQIGLLCVAAAGQVLAFHQDEFFLFIPSAFLGGACCSSLTQACLSLAAAHGAVDQDIAASSTGLVLLAMMLFGFCFTVAAGTFPLSDINYTIAYFSG